MLRSFSSLVLPSAASSRAFATIAGVVFSKCALQRFQYHLEISSQEPTVLTPRRWPTELNGGIPGSSKACGTFFASQTYRMRVPTLSSVWLTVFSTGDRTTLARNGLLVEVKYSTSR